MRARRAAALMNVHGVDSQLHARRWPRATPRRFRASRRPRRRPARSGQISPRGDGPAKAAVGEYGGAAARSAAPADGDGRPRALAAAEALVAGRPHRIHDPPPRRNCRAGAAARPAARPRRAGRDFGRNRRRGPTGRSGRRTSASRAAAEPRLDRPRRRRAAAPPAHRQGRAAAHGSGAARGGERVLRGDARVLCRARGRQGAAGHAAAAGLDRPPVRWSGQRPRPGVAAAAPGARRRRPAGGRARRNRRRLLRASAGGRRRAARARRRARRVGGGVARDDGRRRRRRGEDPWRWRAVGLTGVPIQGGRLRLPRARRSRDDFALAGAGAVRAPGLLGTIRSTCAGSTPKRASPRTR